MLPEITKNLLLQYLGLFLILVPTTIFVVLYHRSLPKDPIEPDEIEPSDEEVKAEAKPKLPEKTKKVDINHVYNELKKKYNPTKAGDKKTRLKYKQILLKVEKAYKIKDIKTLMSL
ncbi:MAG: hypothetical protein WCH76_00465 [Candidatus Riflemargulisbacteria bacterium]